MSDSTQTDPRWLARHAAENQPSLPLALTIAWSLSEPERVGEVAIVSDFEPIWVLGRGSGSSDGDPRLQFCAQRPGVSAEPAPLNGRGLSRRQILFSWRGEEIDFERVGKAKIALNGIATDKGPLRPGDVVTIQGELVLFCTRRAGGVIPSNGSRPGFAFGTADACGIVGESPRIWLLRDEIAFAARRKQHALLVGPSGSGKELAARALHLQSERRDGPFISRNAATLPSGIIDAELFGNTKNYPNAGMPERDGLVGSAHGGTLFLDEISELPLEMQTHFLRLLDSGEYQRLGESRVRVSDLRVIAATNRPVAALKDDLAARFALRIEVPELNACREDIPLVTRHVLQTIAADDAGLASRFFDDTSTGLSPRIAPELSGALLKHRFTHNVRELQALLLLSMNKSRGEWLDLTPEVKDRIAMTSSLPVSHELDAEAIQGALNRNQGSVTRASRELGLKNREALYRLMKKHGIKHARKR